MRTLPAVALASACLLVGLLSTPGAAQSTGGYNGPPSYPAPPGGGGGGGGWGYGGYGGGGTAAGSYLNGMANVVRSAGYYNVMNSVAAQNWEQAYSADLDNRLKATNTYFEMRRSNRAARAEEAPKGATGAELTRYAQEAAPKRLTSTELDPVSGDVNWPSLFDDPRYAKQRNAITSLFTQRQASTGAGSEYRAIVDAIGALRAELGKNIDQYSPQAWVEARKFLDSLQYEARFITG